METHAPHLSLDLIWLALAFALGVWAAWAIMGRAQRKSVARRRRRLSKELGG